MTTYLYKSTTGKAVNAGKFVVTVNPGLQLGENIKDLDLLVGISLTRTTNGVLDTLDASGASSTGINKNLTVSDADTIIKCTAAVTLTILNDTLGGFTSTDTNIIRLYQATSSAANFAAGSGVTLRGTPKTSAQYIVQNIIRVGPNEWAYIT